VFALGQFAMKILTWLFLVGISGSLLVIVISFVEDLAELVGKE
jgi:hypothetical protein